MRGQIRWSYLSVHSKSTSKNVLHCKAKTNSEWEVRQSRILPDLGDLHSFHPGWPPGSGERGPYWLWKTRGGLQRTEQQPVQDQVWLLGKYRKPLPRHRALGSKTLKVQGSSVVFWVDHRAYMPPCLNRIVLCKLGQEQYLWWEGSSFWAFHLPTSTFVNVAILERPLHTIHCRGKGLIPCNWLWDSKPFFIGQLWEWWWSSLPTLNSIYKKSNWNHNKE